MIVTHKISMHLDSVDQEQSIQIVQNDSNARALEVTLYENGAAWPIPEGTTVLFRYLQPNGTSGEYDTLADGSKAWSWEGNVVTMRLLGALSTMTGVVHCTLVLQNGGQLLHSFAVRILVQPDLTGVAVVSDTTGSTGSSGSSGTQTATCLLHGVGARVGQVLRVAAVNYAGVVTALEAAEEMAFDGGYVDSDGLLHLTLNGVALSASQFTPFAVGTAGLPMPETAAVGQSILVAAVDEYGRVTKTVAQNVELLENAEEASF